jgi:hypothetical protein
LLLSATPGGGGSTSRSNRSAPSVALAVYQGQHEKSAKIFIIK